MNYDNIVNSILKEQYSNLTQPQQSNAFYKWVEFYFEDLLNVTDRTVLTQKVRERLETPELVQKYGNAQLGNLVEMVVMQIEQEQKRRSTLKV
jgi:hypothetical protein